MTEYRYDGRGNLRFLIDAADKETEFRYDAFGNVEVVEDALGNEVSFSYNQNGDMAMPHCVNAFRKPAQ